MKRKLEVITEQQLQNRRHWVAEIEILSGNFAGDFARLRAELSDDISTGGVDTLLAHCRLSGAIPEHYGHDSSEEKLYSKYTDALLAEAFEFLGIASLVLAERADAADVECVAKQYSFVADAKAFRLSRTAKNQKDFKVQAMDGWKRGKPYAVVVCPAYQLPTRSSQIYQQATVRDVCVFTYSHLALLIQLAAEDAPDAAEQALQEVFRAISTLNPSKDAVAYWRAVNQVMLDAHAMIRDLWQTEKVATLDAIQVAKEEALTALAMERERIMRLSKPQALEELIRRANIKNRETVINRVVDTGIFGLV